VNLCVLCGEYASSQFFTIPPHFLETSPAKIKGPMRNDCIQHWHYLV
jgi:hypothetical protein